MSDWIRLHDSEWTPEGLTAEIASRAKTREAKLGFLELNIPPFDYQKGVPQPPGDRPYNAALYSHLRILNEMPPLETAPVLGESSAALTPLASTWQRLREQFHELVLFYVNRFARQQSQINNELTAALNELTRYIEVEQEQTQRLDEDLSDQKGPQEKE